MTQGISHLLVFNLVMDVDDKVLGFATGWVNELANHCKKVTVVTMRLGKVAVKPNVTVYSVGKERGFSEARRAIEFYRILWSVLGENVDGCFSHMMPVFSAMAGPLLRLQRIPLVTWYAHPSRTIVLLIAQYFSNRMVTSLMGAYPYKSQKLFVIGQGIDTDLFSPRGVARERFILCAGRLSRVKNHPVLLRAFRILVSEPRFSSLRLVIIGEPSGGDSEQYSKELRELELALNLRGLVEWRRGVTQMQLVDWYRRCSIHVNITPAGFGDKVAWESMSCGTPTVLCNPDFAETLGDYREPLLCVPIEETRLAGCLRNLLEKSDESRLFIGHYLRGQVKRLHSLEQLAPKILQVIASADPQNAR